MSDRPHERRGGPRATIELSVEYKRLNSFFADYTRNISRGGTFIRTDRPLSPGTELSFALAIRGLPEPLRLAGRVAWVVLPADQTEARPAGMGIEFVYADDAERARVEAIVEKLLVDSFGEHLSTRLLGKKA